MTMPLDESREWLEADGLGGFAMGTACGVRTRRYHALVVHARRPPTERVTLLKGVEVWVETPEGRWPLSTQRYEGGVVHPEGSRHVLSFDAEPWPKWRYRLPSGAVVEHEILVERGVPGVWMSWRCVGPSSGVMLHVRPLLCANDFHALHQENSAFDMRAAAEDGGGVRWVPYASMPAVVARSNGRYAHEPAWFRRFLYTEERARGLNHVEDLASPGAFTWDLGAGEAVLRVEPASHDGSAGRGERVKDEWEAVRRKERERRGAFTSRLARAADVYLVRRGAGTSIIAGYPWFADWGRDTFIALRGLCLETGRLAEARDVLFEWAGAVSEGMLPNRFPDAGEKPEYNAVDASLWYVIAAHEYLAAARRAGLPAEARVERTLASACDAILSGYARGTRYGIRLDADGLLAAGEPGVQLTWMDAKLDDWVVTPRVGKPVEVQALWLNALTMAAERDGKWKDMLGRGLESFTSRFWSASERCLLDVVDADHVRGRDDPSIRPNQVFAVGGLPRSLLPLERARGVVEAVERRLMTPLGPRSLAPGSPGYSARYEGGPRERDGAYHQGTVWPWLIGAFVEAWLRVRGDGEAARAEARRRFVDPLLAHLDEGGLGHVSEIFDAEPPRLPRGCPFQAWSVAELIRAERLTSADGAAGRAAGAAAKQAGRRRSRAS